MSPTTQRRKAQLFVLLLLTILALSVAMVGTASANNGPFTEVPGYPKYGCYDLAVGGIGMWNGNSPYWLQVDVPGPVVDAYMFWIGTIDEDAPDAPNQSDLSIFNTQVIGKKVDFAQMGPGELSWHMWLANIGPSGYNLIKQGTNKGPVTGWSPDNYSSDNRRNGVSVVVVYDTGACQRPNQVDILGNMSWYWERWANDVTSEPLIYTFPPAPVDREATVFLHHAGTDSLSRDNHCRPENVWAAIGAGTPPTNIIDTWPSTGPGGLPDPSVGINGGKLVLKNGFTNPDCPMAWYPPAIAEWGWEDAFGIKSNTNGFISSQWSIVKLKVKIPAGQTYLVFQSESPRSDPATVSVTASGESGALTGQFVIALYNPELKIAKTVDVAEAKPGDTLTYTLDYENYGYGAAENSVIVDKLPDHVKYVSASGGGVYDNATRTVTWNLGTLAIGQKGQVTLTVMADPVFEAGVTPLTNTATISTTTAGETNTSDNSASATLNVTATVELAIAKKAAPEPVDAGNNLTYTVDWTVGGNAYAHGVAIVDTLPAGVTVVTMSDAGIYDPVKHTVTWLLGEVTPVTQGSYTVVVNVPSPQYNGAKLTNKVMIGDKAGNTAEASVISTIRSSHELKIEKLASPEPVDAGSDLTYTINWAVTGNEPAKNAMVVDTLPAEVTFVSASGGGVYDPATRKISWSLGEVMTPKNGSFTVVVNVPSPQYNGTKLTNVVDFTDETPGSKPAQTTVVSTIRSSHELKIEKLASPEPVDAGSDLTYTLNWAVTGNEPAKNAMVVDTLPAKVTFVSASGGGVYDPATRKISWSLGEVMTPQNGSFTVVVTVPSPQYNGTLLTNVVDFTDETPGSKPAQTTVVSTVRADHVLVLSKDDSPDPVIKGQDLTYTLNWAVTGNEPADNVVMSDPIPFGTKFVSASGGGVYDAVTNTVTWNLGNKAPGDAGSVTLVVTVNKDFPNALDISNRAAITDDKPGKEKYADATTSVVQTPDGTIGDTVWYDLNGNGIQEPGEPGIGGVGLVLYDAGPDGKCGTADDIMLGNAVTDANGKYRFEQVKAGKYCVSLLDASLPVGLKLVSGANPHGPIVLAEGQIYRDADFGYQVDPLKGAIGDRVWSDANGNGVQDPGEVGIGNVTLDLIKAGADGKCDATDATVVGSTTTAGDGSYLFSGLTPGVYCVKVTDKNNVLTGTTLTGGADPHGPITLVAGQTYLDADFGYQRPAAGTIGDLVFYDANRNGLYEPAKGEHGIGGVTLSLLALDADGKFTVIVATTTTAADGSYLFTGLADGAYRVLVTDLNGRLPGYTQTYGLPDTNDNGQVNPYDVTIAGGNSVLHVDFAYADGHMLTITKVNDVPAGKPVEAGADMVYTISYSVSGRDGVVAPNVVISDPLPLQLDFLEASNGGTYDATTRLVTWKLGDLKPGDQGVVTLKVHVKRPLPNNSYIFNTVTIVDDAKVRDESTDIIRVHAEPILGLTKTVDPTGAVKPGDTLKYTLCYSNTGNGSATDVVLNDMIPGRTTVVPGSYPSGVIYDPVARTLTLPVGVLLPDASVCIDFRVTVDLTLPGVKETPQDWVVHNVARLSSVEKPTLTAETSNPLNAFVKPTLTKTADPAGTVKPGDTITYKLCYANEGNANLTGVVLTDVIPANTTYVAGSATGSGIIYNEATRTLSWNIGTLGPHANACVTFQVTVNMTIEGLTGQAGAMSFAAWNALAITNNATLKNDQVGDKTATVVNALNATVDLAIYKSVNSPIRHVGETAIFTVTVTNRGTANATNVVITDPISATLESVTVTSSKGTVSYDAASKQWAVTVGVLAPNETVTIVIKGMTKRVAPQELPYQIINKATVAFKEGTARESNPVTIDVVYMFPGEVPEASTWLMLGSGLAGLAGYARLRMRTRRRKAA